MLQNATFLRKSAPWPPNTSDDLWWTCLLYCACEAKCIFADLLQMYHACQRFWNCDKTLTFSQFWQGAESLAPATQKRHLNVQKCSEPVSFSHLWLRNVLRAAAACTFSTSQLPKMFRGPSVFNTFDFEMCFAPQRRTFFRHLNLQKVVRDRWLLKLLTSKCASRHNGLQFSPL